MVLNQGSVALKQALTEKKWSHGKLRTEMGGVANGVPGRWISGHQKPDTGNRVWLEQHLGIPILNWDVPVIEQSAPKRKSNGQRKAS